MRMVVRIRSRIEVRLDEAHQRALTHVLEARGQNTSEFVRAAIDEAREAIDDEEFRALVQSFRDDPLDVPIGDELNRELAHAHCPGGEFCDEPQYHSRQP